MRETTNGLRLRRLRFWLARTAAAALLVVVCAAACRAQADFTVIVLPDTQYYAKSYPSIFNAQMDWIVAQRSALNIQLVLGVGDVVDSPTSTQLTRADSAYRILDNAGVPYFAAIGNHDYANAGASAVGLKRNASGFNQYFGPARYATKSYYHGNYGGSNENFWGTINLGGQTYLILALEFYPRNAVLDWAADILEQNSTLPAIVVTHSQLVNNAHVTTCDNYDKESYALQGSNDGEQLWTKLLSQYANIQLVLSGHIIDGKGVARVADLGENGNLVNQIMADYQSYTNGGDGYLRIMKFHPSQNRIDVSTYSPYTGSSLTDPANQFSVPITGGPTGSTGTITGKVRDADVCGALGGVTVADDQGHSAVTDKYGSFTLTGVAPGPVTLTATRAGLRTATAHIRMNGGYTYTVKFSMLLASSAD